MQQITFIYRGPGAKVRSFRNWDTQFLTKRSFFESDWDERASLFVLPGGRDVPYHATFRGKGNEKIRAFVEKGGTFLGMCAGAYYAATFVEFDKGYPSEICEARELKFFQGKTVGPLFNTSPYVYDCEEFARNAKILTAEGKVISTYYNGGCTFIPTVDSDYQVLASYDDLPGKPLAVIACSVGKGKAILSGVHLEMGASCFKPEDPMFKELRPSDEARNKFLAQAILPSTLPPMR